ncbi:MAG: serine O-acetyltransferase EpsC [Polyangiales bacterium]
MSTRHSQNDDDGGWDLSQLVAALRAARDGHNERADEVRRRERPSRDVVAEIVRDLRAVLFPTHFGIPDYSETSLDFFVGNRLDGALRALQEQVRRALRYSVDQTESPEDTAQRARRLVAAFANSLPEMRRILESDLRAAYEGDPAASSRAEILFCYPGVSALINHRLAHELYRLQVPLLPRIMSELAHAVTGIDIHPGAQIGERFFIDHGTGVVIGETAVIGQRVRLYQGVTLGARRFPTDDAGVVVKGQARHPIIEDDVVIYAGATVLGRITIGRGATIGGNVWVTQNVPPGDHITQAKVRHEDLYEGGAGI